MRPTLELSREITAADYLDYRLRRDVMIAAFTQLFDGLDAILLPATANTAPAISALADDKDYIRYNAMALRNSRVANFLNGCAISIPMHLAGEPPSGLSLMGPWGSDAAVFAAAAGVEWLFAGHHLHCS